MPIRTPRRDRYRSAALDYIAKAEPAPDSWKTQQTASIAEIQKPKGQLLLIPATSVQKLVEAAATAGACAVNR